MLKEIFEQPEAIENALRGRIDDNEATAVFGGLNLSRDDLREVSRIAFSACGTSWHAALVGEYVIEELAGVPVDVDYSSELRYRNSPTDARTLFFALAQSGETADTIAALREMKRRRLRSLAIVNVVGSTIAREADGGIFLHAGPEIGVAATKTFTAQLTVLTLLGLYLGRMHRLTPAIGHRITEQMRTMPSLVKRTLEASAHICSLAQKYAHASGVLFLGRGPLFPVALEGALKLKELTYRHAHGYPAGEIKHGPLALIDENTVTIVLAPRGALYEKTLIAIEEVRARKGKVVAVVTEGDTEISKMVDDVIFIPGVAETLQPILAVVPLQLFAYHSAVVQGADVDKPRNLAKSVTVE